MLRNALLLLSVCAVAVVATLYVNSRFQLAALKGELANAKNAGELQRAEVARLRKRLAEIKPTPAPTDSARDPEPHVAVNVQPSAGAFGARGMVDAIRNDPRFASILQRDDGRAVERRYGAGIRKLNLSPEKEQKLRELLAAKQSINHDTFAASADQNLTKAETFTALERSTASVNQEINALIGNDGMAALEQSDRTNMSRTVIQHEMGADLARDGIPLTSEQEAAVAESYAEALPTHGILTPTDPKTGLPASWSSYVDKLQTVLTPEQFRRAQESLAAEVQKIRYYQSLKSAPPH